jgi:cell division septation protein DedD
MAAAEIAPIERIQPIPPAFPIAPPQREPPPLPSPPPEPEPESTGKTVVFSAPLINSLERSKYYLQLGAFTRTELVEQELARIGKNYPVVVLRGAPSGKILYRILLGPVSQGESNALLQRFKNMGYKDAFLRQGS